MLVLSNRAELYYAFTALFRPANARCLVPMTWAHGLAECRGWRRRRQPDAQAVRFPPQRERGLPTLGESALTYTHAVTRARTHATRNEAKETARK